MSGFALGFGFGAQYRGNGGGASLLPLGTLFTAFGDGVMSETAAGGPKNAITRALAEMSGRILPSEAHNLCRSGDSFDIGYARLPYAVGQAPGLFLCGSRGHNDAIMGTDPAGAPGIALMAKWQRDIDYCVANLPLGTKIVCATTIGSQVSGESTYAAAVNALQKAYIAGLGDSRVVLWDAWAIYNHATASGLSHDSAASYTHPDDRGARAMAFGDGSNPGLYDIIDALVQAASKDEVYAWLGTLGTNFDTDYALAGGIGGTKSGTVAPTGDWPTGKRITNNLTNGSGVSVVCSVIDQGSYKQGKAVVSGTPAATNTITMDDTASISATGSTPGRYFAPIVRVRFDDGAGGAPVGLQGWTINWSNFGSLSSTSDFSSSVSDGVGRVFDTIVVCQPQPTYASNGPMAANPVLGMRFSQTAIDTEIIYDRPMLVELYTAARAQPCPVWKAGGFTANYVQRLTGTFSNGQTIRAETGTWSGGGFSNTGFAERKIYEGSAGDIAVGAGTLRATLTGSTWSWTAAGLTPGNVLWLDITVNNGVGAAVTERAGPYTIV